MLQITKTGLLLSRPYNAKKCKVFSKKYASLMGGGIHRRKKVQDHYSRLYQRRQLCPRFFLLIWIKWSSRQKTCSLIGSLFFLYLYRASLYYIKNSWCFLLSKYLNFKSKNSILQFNMQQFHTHSFQYATNFITFISICNIFHTHSFQYATNFIHIVLVLI